MLGCKICEELGFVTKKTLLSSYLDRFKGLGTFKDMKPYHITLDPAAEPVIHPPWSVPVRQKELDDMLNLGVIAPVDRPTDWVNRIVLSENKTDKGEVTRAQSLLRPP